MRSLRRLYWGETRINFTGRARLWLGISGAMIAISIVALIFFPPKLSIDFTGGTSWAVQAKVFDVGKARAAMAPYDVGEVTVQAVGGDTVQVTAKEVAPARAEEISAGLAKAAGVSLVSVSKQSVGPTWGQEVSKQALLGLLAFLVAVIIYISLRYEYKMAITAILEMFHDVLITMGIYALAGFTVSPATVVALLTMLGYSLYDAVVVFDKVRENGPILAAGRLSYSELVNLSMNQVLARSFSTSITSLLPAGSLLFIGSFVLGAVTLQDLALALFIGIASGTYSSVFFASPILAKWKEREPRYQQQRARVEQRRARDVAAPQPTVESVSSAAAGGPVIADSSAAPVRQSAKKPASRPGGGRSHGRPTPVSKKKKKR